MFRKITSQIEFNPEYSTKLTKADLSNESKIDQEIKNIELKFPLQKQIATNVNFDNKEQTLDEFLKVLKQAKFDISEQKDIKSLYDTSLFQNIGGENVDVSTEEGRESLKREIAAIEKQIQVREQTLAEIDNYVVSLLSGEMAQLNIAHTNAKFIKIAKDDMDKEADEVIEDYYNELYEDSVGSPDFGTALEHPKETRNELTTKIHHHRFKKK
jgi:primosomal protein N''